MYRLQQPSTQPEELRQQQDISGLMARCPAAILRCDAGDPMEHRAPELLLYQCMGEWSVRCDGKR